MNSELDIKQIRARLEAAIKENGRSYRSVSLAAGRGPGYVSSILNEGKEPTVIHLAQVCSEIGVSLSQILYGVQISPEAEEILKLLDENPDKRSGILALLSD